MIIPGEIPKVSVVIPTFKRSHIISRSVQSVLNQSYRDFEIIVVNDGFKDNTEEVLKSFNDKRIKYLEHDQNMGQSAARNTGIKAARGQYIAFQDSDDEWLPEKLAKQMRVFETSSPHVGVVYTQRWSTADNINFHIPFSKTNIKVDSFRKNLLQRSLITPQSAMVLADCFKKAGFFDESLHHLEDWELWIRISKYYEFKFLNEPLVKVYHENDNISGNQDNLIKAMESILSKHFENFKGAGKRILAMQYYSLGNLLCRNGDFSRGRKYLLQAIRTNPFNLKYFLTILVSFLELKDYNCFDRLKKVVLLQKSEHKQSSEKMINKTMGK